MSLIEEGRERLLAAFDKVNAHFKELLTLLFDGGTADLQLVESDEPRLPLQATARRRLMQRSRGGR